MTAAATESARAEGRDSTAELSLGAQRAEGEARARWLGIPRLVPTRRLALVIALAAPLWMAAAVPGLGWVPAAGLLVIFASVLLDAAATPGARHLLVVRELPRTIGVGDTVEGMYRIASRWPRTVTLRLYDLFPVAVTRGPGGGAALAVPVDAEAALPFTLTGEVRGAHALGPVTVRASGPLDLVRRTLRYDLADEVLVAPSLAGVRRYRLLALQHRLRDLGVRNLRRRGEGTTFANLREYVLGDDPRHIDWKATARRHKLISREFTVEQGQTVIIAIDAGRLMTQLAGTYSRFEAALSSALVLADIAIHSDDQVGCIVFDDEVRAFVPPARGRLALQAMRDALVPLTATMVEPDFAAAFRTLSARHRKRSLIVLFTDVIDARASQALLAYTMRSAARHLPVVVALRNDELAASAVPAPRESSSTLYANAAAEELLSARDEALLRMRRAGVSVLDVSPAHMTAAVINRYLEIKARASL